MRFAGIVAGIAWAWSLPKLLREWELAGQGQLFTFAISSLVCAPIWWMFRKAEPASQAATRVVRFGTGLIVVSLLVMAGVTQILAFTFFALAAGALLTALGFLAGRSGLQPERCLRLVQCFFLWARCSEAARLALCRCRSWPPALVWPPLWPRHRCAPTAESRE